MKLALKQSLFDFEKFSGDFVGRVTPVPIPNTEVKPAGADGTARETAWESRKSPGLYKQQARSRVFLSGLLLFTGGTTGHSALACSVGVVLNIKIVLRQTSAVIHCHYERR